MFTKTMIAGSVAIILGALGAASAALAGDQTDRSYGGPNQTWQDIARDRQDIQNQIRRLYHTDNPGNAYGYVASPTRKHPRTKAPNALK